LRPPMQAGSPISQNCWSRQECEADGRFLGQPSCIGPIWVRLLSWIPAMQQSQHRPWMISATCLRSEWPKATPADLRSYPGADVPTSAMGHLRPSRPRAIEAGLPSVAERRGNLAEFGSFAGFERLRIKFFIFPRQERQTAPTRAKFSYVRERGGLP